MANHLKVISILYIGFGALGILMALLFLGLMLIGPVIEGDPKAMLIVGSIGAVAAGGILVISLPAMIAGIGMLKRQPWARIPGIIVAILYLLASPVGTAIGIYALWVLLRPETVLLFTAQPYSGSPATDRAG